MSATETVDLVSIPGSVKAKTKKFGFAAASLFDVGNEEGQCEASTVWSRLVVA